jgi:antitoxin component HigA of HigAB toxin-antitoxin module
MKIKPIRTKKDYTAALSAVEKLMQAKAIQRPCQRSLVYHF